MIYSKRKCALLLFAGYLSWMRNTYIMTLAGVAMINSEVAPLSPVAGSGKATFYCTIIVQSSVR